MTPRAHPWWHPVEAQAADPAEPADLTEATDPAEPTDLTEATDGSDPAGARPAGAAAVREPWADRPLEPAALTAAQRAVLAGLDDQPDVPRLDNIAAELPASVGSTEPDRPGPTDMPAGQEGAADASAADRPRMGNGPAAPTADSASGEVGPADVAGAAVTDVPMAGGPAAAADVGAAPRVDRTGMAELIDAAGSDRDVPDEAGASDSAGRGGETAADLTHDQPGVPRWRGGERAGGRPGNGTGNAPGDAEAADPHTRTRWTEQEQQEG